MNSFQIRKGEKSGDQTDFRESAGEKSQEVHGVLFEARVQL
jgi:hypothetical protein